MIKLAKSVVGKNEADAVRDVILGSGYLGMGAEVKFFEKELENYINTGKESEYLAVCVSSGTAALHLAIEALTSPGDEVLVPTITYVATYSAITAAGCIPISCDILADSALIDLSDAKTKISSKTKMILPVHYGGNCGDIDDVYAFAKKNNLRIIEDAAHAFGTSYKGKKIGSFGDVICFSFDGIKNITSGEGGAILTSDRRVIERVRDTRLLGVVGDADKREKGFRSWDFEIKSQGYRYHMSNIFAAIGRVQLQRFETDLAPKRKKLASLYSAELASLSWLTPVNNEFTEIVPHIYPVLVQSDKRPLLEKIFKENNIEYGLHYKPNHLLKVYSSNMIKCPTAERLYNELITLPLHPGILESDLMEIVKVIKKV